MVHKWHYTDLPARDAEASLESSAAASTEASTVVSKAAQFTPIIWLHGWGQDHSSLLKIAKSLNYQGQQYLFDQPGFGQTAMLPKGSDTADYAAQLLQQLEAIGVTGPVTLVGHSFGARVAVQLAAAYPDRVDRVIMISGAGLKQKRSIIWRLKALRLKIMGKMAYLSDRVFGTDKLAEFRRTYGSADYRNAGELRETFVKVVNEDLSQKAKQLPCPALMIYGSEDRETPPAMGQRYARLIPFGRYVECRGFGHLDILDRGAYQVKALMEDFLQHKDNP